ncbi:MAG: protein-glutamate O-methyltransferase CheR [Nitrospirae bacterium]|nr:MAG: protein-glutamate O-methyltransferase CheR [Nitrospirota bacterium]
MLQLDKGPVLTQEVFRLLRDLINQYSGLYFDDSYREIFQHRLQRRLSVHKLGSFMDYYRFLLYDPRRHQEMETLMDILTVNETYFFREVSQFEVLVKEIIPEILDNTRPGKTLRMLSAGCSTGEEPYTMAIFCFEYGILQRTNLEIIGIDISKRVLSRARSGIYTENSFRATDKRYLEKYFIPLDNHQFRIDEKLKKVVTFYHGNLLDSVRLGLFSPVDIVFCRNVLIYFDMRSRKRVINNLYRVLRPGGYLFLGHSESLLSIPNDFEFLYKGRELVYRKPQ